MHKRLYFRYLFVRHSGAIVFWILVFSIHSVSTSTKDLGKKEKELLRWLDIDPGPNPRLSSRLKRYRRYALKEPVAQGQQEMLELFHFDNSLSSTTSKSKSRGKNPPQIQGKKRMEIHRTNESGSSDPLKRPRRQAEQAGELPNWPGMPLAELRQANVPTANFTTQVKKKILNMMVQSLYSVQERLWPVGPIADKYEFLTPYRMAFIFMKLDQLVHESNAIIVYLERETNNPAMTMTRRLQMYSQLLRRSVDVTYLVDYIMQRVPRDQVIRISHWLIRNEQEGIMSAKSRYDKTTTQLPGRPAA